MSGRLLFKPSDLAETTVIKCWCNVCGFCRKPDVAWLIEHDMDVNLIEIERKIRCKAHGKSGKEPECGGTMWMEIWVPTVRDENGHTRDAPICKPGH